MHSPRKLPRSAWLPGLLILSLLGAESSAAQGQRGSWADAAPLWREFCATCHQGAEPKGEIALAGEWTETMVSAERGRWESALEMLESGAMPPDDQPQPSAEQRGVMLQGLRTALYAVDCEQPQDPGRATPRRLNRAEYNNTVRDLLLVSMQPADAFPSDDVGDGFDNIGDVLSLPPLLMEKYLEAAEQLAQSAIVVRDTRTSSWRIGANQLKKDSATASSSQNAVCLFTNGRVTADWSAPCNGVYRITWLVSPDLAGPELPQLAGHVNQQPTGQWEVEGPEGSIRRLSSELQLKAGNHTLAATFTNDFYDARKKQDRNLNVHGFKIELLRADEDQGPYPASHAALVVARPGKQHTLPQAAEKCLRPFANRAFRRPVSEAELGRYLRLVEDSVREGATFEEGLRVAVTAVLISPHFLFRVIEQGDSSDGARAQAIDDFELASRISYFLWSTMPDDRLFELAGRGVLHEPEVLRAEIQRLLSDPRSVALADNFAAQWLNLRTLNDVQPDAKKFAAFDDDLRRDAMRETLLFFEGVLREDLPITTFLTGRFSFLNERLAAYYGASGVSGEEFRRVSLEGLPRAGVLTQASVLTLTSNPTRTSPVKRGKWILENLLDAKPPDPPPNVPNLEQTAEAEPTLTLRQQLELHRRDPVCASCHRQMDALGFGLENFDAIGRWRDDQGGQAIDASGQLSERESFTGPLELARVLDQRREDFRRALASKMLTYAIGRGLTHRDACAVNSIVERVQASEDRFSALIWGVVTSDPFLKRRGEEEQP